MAEFFASKDWQTFLDVLPSIPAETWDTFYSTVVATLFALVIGLHLWKHQILLSVAGGTLCYMLLVQLVF